ncbi:MAG: hypothetical protein HQK53_11085 [Oligoflexia bacterium]|nr:hypothetical protein [Oligoflexia bacterium]
MSWKRKALLVGTSLLMMVVFGGCGDDKDDNKENKDKDAKETKADDSKAKEGKEGKGEEGKPAADDAKDVKKVAKKIISYGYTTVGDKSTVSVHQNDIENEASYVRLNEKGDITLGTDKLDEKFSGLTGTEYEYTLETATAGTNLYADKKLTIPGDKPFEKTLSMPKFKAVVAGTPAAIVKPTTAAPDLVIKYDITDTATTPASVTLPKNAKIVVYSAETAGANPKLIDSKLYTVDATAKTITVKAADFAKASIDLAATTLRDGIVLALVSTVEEDDAHFTYSNASAVVVVK